MTESTCVVGAPSIRFVYFFLFSGLSGKLLIHVSPLDVDAILVLMVCLHLDVSVLDAHDVRGGVGRRVYVFEIIPAVVSLVVVGLAFKGLEM